MKLQRNKCFRPSQHLVTISPYHIDMLLCPQDRRSYRLLFLCILFNFFLLKAPEAEKTPGRQAVAHYLSGEEA